MSAFVPAGGEGARLRFACPADKELAVRKAREISLAAGFGPAGQEEMALVMGELASNAIKYGGPRAEIGIAPFSADGNSGVELVYSSPVPLLPAAPVELRASPGIGLDVIRNHVDEFRLDAGEGGGMRLFLRKYVPRPRRPALSAEITVLTAPAAGERWNGDGYFVDRGQTRILVAVFDALGHGRGAFEVAEQARQACAARCGWGVEPLMERLQSVLAGTRGMAVSAVSVDLVTGEGEYSGVGNVEARWLMSRQALSFVPAAGFAGKPGQRVRVLRFRVEAPGLLLLASDGISLRHLDEDVEAAGLASPLDLAAGLMDRRARLFDDHTVLAAWVREAQGACPGGGR